MQTRIIDKITSLLFRTDASKIELTNAVKSIQGDPNATFSFEEAIHFLLFEAKEKQLQKILAPRLRAVMVQHFNYIESQADGWPYQFYMNFIHREIDGNHNDPEDAYKKYIAAHAQDKTWGTYAEAMALAELFDLSLVFYLVDKREDMGERRGDPSVMRKAAPGNGVVTLYCVNIRHWYLVYGNPDETYGDGNCLYNAWAQALRQLAVHQKYADKNRDQSRSSPSRLNSNAENNLSESKQEDEHEDSSQDLAPSSWDDIYRDQRKALRILEQAVPAMEDVNASVQQAIEFLQQNPDYTQLLKEILQDDLPKQPDADSVQFNPSKSGSRKQPNQDFSWLKAILLTSSIVLSLVAIISGVGALAGVGMFALIGQLAAELLVLGGVVALLTSSMYAGYSIQGNNKPQQDSNPLKANNTAIHKAYPEKGNSKQPKATPRHSVSSTGPASIGSSCTTFSPSSEPVSKDQANNSEVPNLALSAGQ
jgi:predicted phage tail protein